MVICPILLTVLKGDCHYSEEPYGNEPPEFDVFGLIYNSHPATAKLLDDAVMRDVLADH